MNDVSAREKAEGDSNKPRSENTTLGLSMSWMNVIAVFEECDHCVTESGRL
jgi:hypothetical protein